MTAQGGILQGGLLPAVGFIPMHLNKYINRAVRFVGALGAQQLNQSVASHEERVVLAADVFSRLLTSCADIGGSVRT